MADAYGILVAAKSKDCICNIEGLVDKLNEYYWSNGDGQWVVSEGTLWFDTMSAQYPTILVSEISGVNTTDEKTGDEIFISVDDATEDDFENGEEVSEPLELSKYAEIFTPYITQGSITLATSSNEKNRTAKFEALELNSNGNIFYRASFVSCWGDTKYTYEEYIPSDEERIILMLRKKL